MLQQTPFYKLQKTLGAKFTDFSGWELPLHYGSQLIEHHQVRTNVGIFDVSHMTAIEVQGTDATSFMRHLFSNDVGFAKDGQALYGCLLNEAGGILDDLIVYRLSPTHYRLITNCSTKEKNQKWFATQRNHFKITITWPAQTVILAIQGPHTFRLIAQVFDTSLSNAILKLNPFTFLETSTYFVARTGYTGERGIEILCNVKSGLSLWQKCIEYGTQPCGLGARDTLRLEAGFNLYGVDMDETTNPFNSNLAWTVSWKDPNRIFLGKKALEKLETTTSTKLTGLILESGVLRHHQPVETTGGIGEITSGGYSPILKKGIALARVPLQTEKEAYVIRRDTRLRVQLTKPPFIAIHR